MGPKKKLKEEVPTVPTIWQWRSDDGCWTEFNSADSVLLETSYGSKKPVLKTSAMSFSTGNDVIFDFKAMTQVNDETKKERKIRRLGLGIWEWKDDNDLFCEYYDEDTALLEVHWRTMKGGSGSFSTKKLSFNVGYDSKYTFTINENAKGEVTGVQHNEDSGTKREIRRRKPDEKDMVWETSTYGIAAIPKPELPPAPAGGTSGVEAVSKSVFSVPDYWEPQTVPFQKFPVTAGGEEYNRVLKRFFQTIGPKPEILSVKRLQNEALWRFYALTRHAVAVRNGGNANEMELFHGARLRENMNAIENFGFDMRVARDGSAGIGIYFAVNASYSNGGYVLRHPDNSREMYVCRVAVGQHTQGKHGMKRPPPKTGKKADKEDLYDSVHNGKPICMYIVFNNCQAYPEYVIHYKPPTPKSPGWF